jgi:PEP-CTERM motif
LRPGMVDCMLSGCDHSLLEDPAMHRTLALLAASLALLVTPVEADVVTIDFSSLDAQSGQTITSFDSQGFRVQDTGGMTIVGSSDPAYLGQTGVIPFANNHIGGFLQIFMPASYPADFQLNSVSINVGPANGVSQDMDIQGIAYFAAGSPVTIQEWNQTITGITTLDMPVNQQATLVTFTAANASAFAFTQVTSITIDFTPSSPPPPSVPEPSSVVLAGLGAIGILGLTARCRSRR